MPGDARLPHEILLAIARGEAIEGHVPSLDQRMTAARIAAPFYAPRLASVVHEAGAGGQVVERIEMAEALTARGIPTARGAAVWTPMQVSRALKMI